MKPALFALTTATLLFTGYFIGRTSTKSTDHFELWKSENHDYLLNKSTGQVWRYYRNTDTNGNLKNEGFCPLDSYEHWKPKQAK